MRLPYALLAGCLLALAGCTRTPDEAAQIPVGEIALDQTPQEEAEARTETERRVQQPMATLLDNVATDWSH